MVVPKPTLVFRHRISAATLLRPGRFSTAATRLSASRLSARNTRLRLLNASSRRSYHELSYDHYGEPYDVLKYHQHTSIVDDPPLSYHDDDNDDTMQELVQIEMIHAPWNPADVNTVQGRYANPYSNPLHKPSTQSLHFPGQSVAGSEGLARVVASQSESLPEGSLVTVAQPGLGTLRSSLWVPEEALLPVPEALYENIGPAAASTLFQLGGTALRLLADFYSSPGAVLQNAGNSGVGLMVSQLTPLVLDGAQCVSLVRRGTKSPQEFERMVEYLTTHGNNALVVAEEDLHPDNPNHKEYRQHVADMVRSLSGDEGGLAGLALNSVGGSSASSLLRLLRPGGRLVTYGGMSGRPVQVGTPQLIFQNLQLAGYWHSRWMIEASRPDQQALVDTLSQFVLENNVQCPPTKVFPLSQVQEGLRWHAHQTGLPIRSKLVFDCQQ